MSELKSFLKGNKEIKENTTYKASKYFKDENGDVLDWVIRPVSSQESDKLKEECTTNILVKKGVYSPKLDTNKYVNKLIVASIVSPDLNNKELQDSYGVMCAEELIKEMIDSPGEYDKLVEFISKFNDFDVTIEDKVEEAKN